MKLQDRINTIFKKNYEVSTGIDAIHIQTTVISPEGILVFRSAEFPADFVIPPEAYIEGPADWDKYIQRKRRYLKAKPNVQVQHKASSASPLPTFAPNLSTFNFEAPMQITPSAQQEYIPPSMSIAPPPLSKPPYTAMLPKFIETAPAHSMPKISSLPSHSPSRSPSPAHSPSLSPSHSPSPLTPHFLEPQAGPLPVHHMRSTNQLKRPPPQKIDTSGFQVGNVTKRKCSRGGDNMFSPPPIMSPLQSIITAM